MGNASMARKVGGKYSGVVSYLAPICILISALEKLVTYISMRMFPHRTGEYSLLALQAWDALGLELGTVILFGLSAMCVVGIKKVADIYPRSEKIATVAFIIGIIVYTYVLISNLRVFISIA